MIDHLYILLTESLGPMAALAILISTSVAAPKIALFALKKMERRIEAGTWRV